MEKKINYKELKKSLSNFTTGIIVIGINHKKKLYGKTINSFSSLSLKPPLILFSLSKKSSSIKKYISSKFISLNILSNKQKKISIHFSKNDNWHNMSYKLSKKNVPILNDCLTNYICEIKKLSSEGDHYLFICKINNIYYADRCKPLIYSKSKYFKN